MEINGIRNLNNVAKDVIQGRGRNNNIQSTSERFASTYLLKAGAILTGLITIPVVIGIIKDIAKPTRYNQQKF
jgi:hypothetical protein